MFKTIARKTLLWATQTDAYKYFLKNILPKMQFRKKKYSKEFLHFKHLQLVTALNERFRDIRYAQGVVISTRDSSKISGLLVPTDLDHTAIISHWNEKESDFEIIQALGEGVVTSLLRELCTSCEGFVAHIGEDWDYDYTKLMVEKAKTFIGKPYDGSFQFGIEALYCSEIVYLADFEKRVRYDTSDFAGIGQQYISPKGITEGVGMIKLFDTEIE